MEAYQLPDAPLVTDQYNAIKTLIENFRVVSNMTLNYENDLFKKKVELMKKHRVEFRSIVRDTIRHSNNLVEFGEDLIEFYDGYELNRDKLNHLNLLLIDARINRTAIETTNLKIKSLLKDMLQVTEDLAGLQDPKNIDPSTYNNLTDVKAKKERYKNIAITLGVLVGIGVSIGVGFGVSELMSRGAKEVAKKVVVSNAQRVISLVAGSAVGSAAGGVAEKMASLPVENKRAEASMLEKTLSERKNQITEKSDELKEIVDVSMKSCLQDLESFWIKYVTSLEKLIEKHKFINENESPTKELINRSRWVKAIEECKNYSHGINNEINADIYVNQNSRDNRLVSF
ncbi:hypothetical protein Glove_166g210 [Diversispora epigaea]|uniref:Uncharacterized protein n=1 Tax=Diversispora epigaea TaxID=1348612 RepID=A0A397IU43_9GLOM|nr:hypothetical protein Glove_166g210 [Diversispora epigaea]